MKAILFMMCATGLCFAETHSGPTSETPVQEQRGRAAPQKKTPPDVVWYLSHDCYLRNRSGIEKDEFAAGKTVNLRNGDVLATQQIQFTKVAGAKPGNQRWEMLIKAGLTTTKCEFDLLANSYSPSKTKSLFTQEEPIGSSAKCWHPQDERVAGKETSAYLSFDKNGLTFWPTENTTSDWKRKADSPAGKKGEAFTNYSSLQKFYPGTEQAPGGTLDVSLSYTKDQPPKLSHYGISHACNDGTKSALGIDIQKLGTLEGNNGNFAVSEKSAPTARINTLFSRFLKWRAP
jgi:hypothetical protein